MLNWRHYDILRGEGYLCAGPGNANIRCVELQDLAEEYKSKTDEELLRLALDPTQLTPEANSALNDELARRRINNAERIRAFREEEERRKEEQSKDTGSLFLIHPYGIGRMRFGKADRSYGPKTSIEQFKTPVFVVLFWLPLIPTGTFLVERESAFLRNQMIVLKRLLLDWEQVLNVWLVTAGTLLAVIWAFKLLPRLHF